MNLVIDIGNSSSKIAIFENGEIIEHFTTENLSIEMLVEIKLKNPALDKAIISSVAKVDEAILKYLQQHFALFIKLNHKTPVPIENLYGTPETLGLDRLAAAVGANFLFPSCNLLVIDAGTAITYDIVDLQNRFLGGNISPGIYTRFRSLHHFTHQLPLVEKANDWPMIGKNTKEAIRSGVLNGIIFEMDGMIDQMKKEFAEIKTIVTGGSSFFFDKKLKNTIFVRFEITLIGLNRILEYNYNAKNK